MRVTLERGCGAIESFVRAVARIGFVLFPALIIVCCLEVGARYLMNAPTIWAYDITFMVHGALFMLTGAYGLQKKVHVRIDVFSSQLPERAQHALSLFGYVVCFIPAVLLLGVAAIRRSFEAYATDEVELVSAWGPLVWPFFTALALGLVALVLQAVVEAIRHAVFLLGDRGGAGPSVPTEH